MKAIERLGWAVALLVFAGSVAAHPPYHHHYPRSSVSLGFYFGDPWYPFYPYPPYPPRVYMPAPVIVTPLAPPVYIEQPRPQTLEPGYWYYCNESKAYYPYVKECPGPWQKVPPQPAQ